MKHRHQTPPGPTETAVQAAGVCISTGNVSVTKGLIGRPTDCNVWVVRDDDHNELVPKGDTGELLVDGHALALGYLEDEAKTKATFVDSSIDSETRRAFKTGDLPRGCGRQSCLRWPQGQTVSGPTTTLFTSVAIP